MLKKRWFKWTAGILVVLIVVSWVTGLGEAIVGAFKLVSSGKIDIKKAPKRTYTADRNENLQSLQTALMLYLDNEGQFPQASGWMAAIQKDLRPSDMQEGEELKKLKNPAVEGGLTEDEFGYRFNIELSGKGREAIKNPKTIIVEESPDDLTYNANGKIQSKPGTRGINAEGEIVSN